MGKIDQDLFLDKLVKAGLLGSKSPNNEIASFLAWQYDIYGKSCCRKHRLSLIRHGGTPDAIYFHKCYICGREWVNRSSSPIEGSINEEPNMEQYLRKYKEFCDKKENSLWRKEKET